MVTLWGGALLGVAGTRDGGQFLNGDILGRGAGGSSWNLGLGAVCTGDLLG